MSVFMPEFFDPIMDNIILDIKTSDGVLFRGEVVQLT